MTESKFIVFSSPVVGREAEYNRWYDEVHLGEVCQVPGFTGARRFSARQAGPVAPKHDYLAIYDITGDADAALAELMARASDGRMRMSDALGEVETMLYEALPTSALTE